MVIATVQINTYVHFSVFNGQGLPGHGRTRRSLSNPPPDAPVRYSSPPEGTMPVSAMCHVLASKSGVQRKSPMVSKVGFLSQRERLHRALLGAGSRAVQPDAPVGIPGEQAASLHFVDPIRTYLDALAARYALFAATESVFPNRIPKSRWSFHNVRDFAVTRVHIPP